MTWHELDMPPAKKALAVRGMVSICVTKPGKHRPRAVLTVRTDPSLGALAWIKGGARVRAEAGTGDHAGLIRLTAGGKLIFAKRSHKAANRDAGGELTLRDLPGMPVNGLAQVDVAWEVAGEALIVTLPWASKATPKAEPATAMPSAPVTRPPPLPAAPPPAKPAPAPAVASSGPPIEMIYASVIPLAREAGFYSETKGIDLAAFNAARQAAGKRPIKIRRSGVA